MTAIFDPFLKTSTGLIPVRFGTDGIARADFRDTISSWRIIHPDELDLSAVARPPAPGPHSRPPTVLSMTLAPDHPLTPTRTIKSPEVRAVWDRGLGQVVNALASDDPIVVARHGGVDYVVSGHARVAVARVTGEHVPAKLEVFGESVRKDEGGGGGESSAAAGPRFTMRV